MECLNKTYAVTFDENGHWLFAKEDTMRIRATLWSVQVGIPNGISREMINPNTSKEGR